MAKLTVKQEKFAQAYVETGNASEAYRQAYSTTRMKPETVNRKAKELLDYGKITARIEKLREEHRARHDVTIDNLTRELDEDRKLARDLGKVSAAVSAVMGKARLHGLLIDRKHITGDIKINPEELTDAELVQIIRKPMNDADNKHIH